MACKMHIFMDFDGTITTKDTIGILMEYIMAHDHNTYYNFWTSHCKWYAEQCEAYEKAHCPSLAPGDLQYADQLDLRAVIDDYVNGRAKLELESVERLNACGIFSNTVSHELYEAGCMGVNGGKVKIRSGFAPLLDFMRRERMSLTVLSVNWSDDWIMGCLRQWPHLAQVDLVSNHISRGARITGPPFKISTPDGLLLTGANKLEAMRATQKRIPALGDGMTFVYIGDSTTDLPCMLACDHAIVMVNEAPSPLRPNFVIDAIQAIHRCEVKNVKQSDSNFRFAWARDMIEVQEGIKILERLHREPHPAELEAQEGKSSARAAPDPFI